MVTTGTYEKAMVYEGNLYSEITNYISNDISKIVAILLSIILIYVSYYICNKLIIKYRTEK